MKGKENTILVLVYLPKTIAQGLISFLIYLKSYFAKIINLNCNLEQQIVNQIKSRVS